MAQRAIKNVKEDVLKCPICLDPYTNPRILPCEHTLCLECLTEYIAEARRRLGTFDSFMCPVCKNRYEIDPNMDSDGVAKTFPVSTFLEAINQAVNLYESPEMSCGIHDKRLMEFYCFTDHSVLCSHCLIENHRYQKCEIVTLKEGFNKKKDKVEEMRQELVNQIKEMDEVVSLSHKMKIHQESIQKTKLDLHNIKWYLRSFYQNALAEIDQMEKVLAHVPYIIDNSADKEIGTLTCKVEKTKSELENIDKGLNFCLHFDNIKSQCDDLSSKFKTLKEKSEANSKVIFVPRNYIKYLKGKPKPLMGKIQNQGNDIALS
ncbi:tripartite motif-containing protein 3-like [Mytilus edulis]|uniref:tripartite motif-containing protein 3-like n=1 Tax=Mytilus edulis TaxID=6550 RepID=UPI0039EF0ECF